MILISVNKSWHSGIMQWLSKFTSPLLFGLLLLFGSSTTPTFAAELLQNPGFETGFVPWEDLTSTVDSTVSGSLVHIGDWALAITNTSSTARGVYQPLLGIVPGEVYDISGWVNAPGGVGTESEAFLRIAWYSSMDGSGSQLSTNDSPTLSSPVDWTNLSFEVEAPANAHSAKLRLYVRSLGEEPATVYFDDLSMFYESVEVPVFGPLAMVMAGGLSAGWWWIRKQT